MRIQTSMQIHRNYEAFKEAITKMCDKNSYTEDERNEAYTIAKARLYGIDISQFSNDPIGLEQAIEEIDIDERKIKDSNRQDYYQSRGC